VNRRVIGLISTIILGVSLSLSFFFLFLLWEDSEYSTDFPFKINGGTLLEYNHVSGEAFIWNQGFNLTFSSITIERNQTLNISIFNIQTENLSIYGLLDQEKYSIHNSTFLSLKIISIPQQKREIVLKNEIQGEIFKIAAIGDTQGFYYQFKSLTRQLNCYSYSFLVHLGDITSFGTVPQFNEVQRITRNSTAPVFFTPGNHDIKSENSCMQYQTFFGESNYCFKFGNFLFISLDSSTGSLTSSTMDFLFKTFSTYYTQPKVIFTHIPLFDPRASKDHDFLNDSQSDLLLKIFAQNNVRIVLSGHIHIYNYTIRENIHFITSGGGGAALHESKELGGFHHYLEITFNNNHLNWSVKPIEFERRASPLDIEVIKDQSVNIISVSDLQLEFDIIYGQSSFQNQYDNWRSYGEYRGVLISDLLETVGGMTPNHVLEIETWDGLIQNFSYPVIFPNNSWKIIQGDVILAYAYNETFVPEWIDGYRIVFLAPDGAYSNDDCQITSPLGEGFHIWPSAGYRWMKYVKFLRILER